MFIRKKKLKSNEYAYLVKNSYNKRKKQSRQTAKKYLGRVIKIESSKDKTSASSMKESIINELLKNNFKLSKNRLIKEDIVVDLENISVNENCKEICLELNNGFLCKYTLSNLLNFDTHNLNQKELIQKLAESLVLAGVNLDNESFVKIFNSINKV